ncbi:hypothetical protein ACHHYP_01186 [Achlya hypogyna]|uniref:Uncharacterized protein n=1 Tax=Achlya hypogyna TaxID=1202772 RepID=A0A1V9ZTP1_ACHHY|nr:hypothetical protein ACHHYP_01186 [Achlya hypogyna]
MVQALEARLAAKLFVSPTDAGPAEDPCSRQLVAAKKYYVHRNMQLRALLQKYQAGLDQTLPRMGSLRPLVLDDAFVRAQIQRAKDRLDPIQMRGIGLVGKPVHGWDCLALTQPWAMVYDIEKHFKHLSMSVMADFLWHVYHDSATYIQLADLIIDHKVVRKIGNDIIVLMISTWLTSAAQAIPMYLVVYREQRACQYALYVATLRPDLTPNPHTFMFHGEETPQGYKSGCKGEYCLSRGVTIDADTILEQMIFSHCRFEALLRANLKEVLALEEDPRTL